MTSLLLFFLCSFLRPSEPFPANSPHDLHPITQNTSSPNPIPNLTLPGDQIYCQVQSRRFPISLTGSVEESCQHLADTLTIRQGQRQRPRSGDEIDFYWNEQCEVRVKGHERAPPASYRAIGFMADAIIHRCGVAAGTHVPPMYGGKGYWKYRSDVMTTVEVKGKGKAS